MNIYYLYVKTHKKTGLKYLGQTKQDVVKYHGSGIYWLNHLKKHGEDHNTQILQRCYSKSALKEWGLYYSNLWSVVSSNKWANLKPESGDGGTTSEVQNRPERLEKNRQSALDMWANEDHKKMRVEKMTNGLNQPGVQERKSTSLKKKLNTPEGKKKNLDSLVVARSSDNWKEKVCDLTIYEFRHRDGRVEVCTRNELIKKYGLHRGSVSAMILRKKKYKSVKGWYLNSKN
jgi:hypothetical protein